MIGTIIAKNRCAKRSHGTPDITKHKHLATNSEKILISVSVKEDQIKQYGSTSCFWIWNNTYKDIAPESIWLCLVSWLGLSLACWKNIYFPCPNSQVLLLSKWEHHCQKYLKRTKKIDLDNLCAPVIDRDTSATRGMTRVRARLKEKHPGILSCHQLFNLTTLG